nr:uncharacterized mitochondrial protein AtMg00810-like [Tanacetum cinerariifolium]
SAFLYGTIKEEVYVCQPLGFEDPDYLTRFTKWSSLCMCSFQVTPKASHLHILKRIFRYLKGKPHLGLWYPKDPPFDLVAYSDSNYDGASLDRKSTTGGCKFLRCRLISWQCKKQTVMATSSSEAEYVATARVNTPRCDEDRLELMKLTVFLLPSDEKVRIKVNDVIRLQALVDKKKVVITEATLRDAIRLDDAEGIECLPNEEIFAELARMGYEKPSTKLTFYKAFFLKPVEVSDLHHTAMVGKGFSRVKTPLFEGMIVEQQVDEGADEVHDKSVPVAGISAEGVVSAADDEVPTVVEEPSIPSPTPPTPPPQPSQDQLPKVENLEQDKIAQALEITKLKLRVKKLERRNKASKLKRLKKGRMIADMDADIDVILEDANKEVAVKKSVDVGESVDVQGRQAESQAQIYQIDLEHANKVLSMQDDEGEPAELQEVVEIPERHVSPTPYEAMLTRWRSRVALRSSSPTTSIPEIFTTPILPAPSAIVAPLSKFPLTPVVEMLRLQGLSSNTPSGVPYTDDEIMVIFCRGKQKGHILGVGRVFPGQGTVIPPLPPYTHTFDVVKLKKSKKRLTRQENMFMKLFRSDDKFSQMLTHLESQPEYDGGSRIGGCEDDEPGDDEDGGEDEEDEEDANNVARVSIHFELSPVNYLGRLITQDSYPQRHVAQESTDFLVGIVVNVVVKVMNIALFSSIPIDISLTLSYIFFADDAIFGGLNDQTSCGERVVCFVECGIILGSRHLIFKYKVVKLCLIKDMGSMPWHEGSWIIRRRYSKSKVDPWISNIPAKEMIGLSFLQTMESKSLGRFARTNRACIYETFVSVDTNDIFLNDEFPILDVWKKIISKDNGRI